MLPVRNSRSMGDWCCVSLYFGTIVILYCSNISNASSQLNSEMQLFMQSSHKCLCFVIVLIHAAITQRIKTNLFLTIFGQRNIE